MGNNETRMIVDLADKASDALSQGRKQVQKLADRSGIFTATVTARDKSFHTLTIRNADGSAGDTYPNVPSTDGREYEINDIVQFQFGKVSPLPKIIGASSSGVGGNANVTTLGFLASS